MPKEHVPDGIPYVKVRDMKGDKINVSSLQRTSPAIAAQYARASLKAGDILLAIRGTYGRVAEVPPELDGGNITQDTARLVPSRFVDRRYLALFLRSEYSQEYFKSVARGVAVRGVNIGDVRLCPVLLPPLAEQAKIAEEVEKRLKAADRLAKALEQQLARAATTRESLLSEALTGSLVPQSSADEPASALLARLRSDAARTDRKSQQERRGIQPTKPKRSDSMKDQTQPPAESLLAAWNRIGRKADARLLFDEAGFDPDHVEQFYEALRGVPEIRTVFQEDSQANRQRQKPIRRVQNKTIQPSGSFRLVELWLEDFKNLKDYEVRFDPAQGLDVVLGWNGTGKSNLFEALIIIFRDLHEWWEKNRWPDKPMNGFRLSYEMDEHTVEIIWRPGQMKRPELKRGPILREEKGEPKLESIKREELPLPRFVFGYYSGPTNRLAEHFLPMKQDHYDRLRLAKADDAKTLAKVAGAAAVLLCRNSSRQVRAPWVFLQGRPENQRIPRKSFEDRGFRVGPVYHSQAALGEVWEQGGRFLGCYWNHAPSHGTVAPLRHSPNGAATKSQLRLPINYRRPLLFLPAGPQEPAFVCGRVSGRQNFFPGPGEYRFFGTDSRCQDSGPRQIHQHATGFHNISPIERRRAAIADGLGPDALHKVAPITRAARRARHPPKPALEC